MRVSDRNVEIAFRYKTKVSDGMGNFNETSVTTPTILAKKITLSSDEAKIAMSTTGIAVHLFQFPYRSDVKSSWIVVEGIKTYAIVGPPRQITRRPGDRLLEITVKEAA